MQKGHRRSTDDPHTNCLLHAHLNRITRLRLFQGFNVTQSYEFLLGHPNKIFHFPSPSLSWRWVGRSGQKKERTHEGFWVPVKAGLLSMKVLSFVIRWYNRNRTTKCLKRHCHLCRANAKLFSTLQIYYLKAAHKKTFRLKACECLHKHNLHIHKLLMIQK